MPGIAKKLSKILKPTPYPNAWILDAITLLVFGTWFGAGLYSLIGPPEPYSCGGPGFADFGCAGGGEAIVANVVGVVFIVILLAIDLIAISRLYYRMVNK